MNFFASLFGRTGSKHKSGPENVEPIIVEADSPIAGPGGVTGQNLGIETLGGVFTALIPSGTAFPCAVTETFSTAADGQTAVSIKLYRGVRIMAQQNYFLGDFQITGFPPSPRGIPQIHVTFQITAEREILLTAWEARTQQAMGIVRM